MWTGEIKTIDANLRATIEGVIEKMAEDALRTISIAYRDVKGAADLTAKDSKGVYDIETKDLTLMGIFGIRDNLRTEVPGAIEICKQAGIKVRMVTGDNKITARAIAKGCGIIDPSDPNAIVMEGPDFMQAIGGVVCKICKEANRIQRDCDHPRDGKTADKLKKPKRIDTIDNGAEFDRIVPNLCVLARSRPDDK